ncbi:MAG: hypothetical protein KGN31_08220 [Betaproteobacteria bacterium]|nr:hypothetical protein [Betaproteobacteria bacterium]MDE2424175.1 hypothetical protein [Betaproteobacteria bacterium]
MSLSIKTMLFLVGFFCATLSMASGGPPMITDDPETPGEGNWEINLADYAFHGKTLTTNQLPLIDANYGWGENKQIKVQTPYLLESGVSDANINGDTRTGLGQSLAGIKWRFYDNEESEFKVSTYPQVGFNLPFTSSTQRQLSPKGVNVLLPVEFLKEWGKNDINVEIGRWFRPDPQNNTLILGVVYTRKIDSGFDWMLEWHDERDMHINYEEAILNTGTRYMINKNLIFLFAIGKDLHNTLGETNSLITYSGVQIRI